VQPNVETDHLSSSVGRRHDLSVCSDSMPATHAACRILSPKPVDSMDRLWPLGCPSLINISCVNALAASDFVIVPVLPSKQATDRVTILVERLKEFHDNLNTDLRVMGFFANRTKSSELTADERNRLSALRDKCKDTWCAAPCFDTFIRQSMEIRRTEDERRTLCPGDGLYSAFVKLAQEVENRLPLFCRSGIQAVKSEEAAL
jgi:hypothetical protein